MPAPVRRLRWEPLEDRLAPAGTPDPSFGANGAAAFSFPGGTFAPAGVAVRPDGAVVLAGRFVPAGPNQPGDTAAVRLLPDGKLDPTFGAGGLAVVPVDFNGPTDDGAADVAVLPDGRVVLGGAASNAAAGPADPVASAVTAVRLLADGKPDPTFGTGGVAVVSPPRGRLGSGNVGVTARAVDALPDGRVAVAATMMTGGIFFAGQPVDSTPPVTSGVVVRLTADGRPDPAFGGGGLDAGAAVVTFGATGFDTDVGDMALLADGRVVLAGSFPDAGGGPNFAAVRLLPGGAPDPGFGAGGRVVLTLPTPPALAGKAAVVGGAGVAVRSDGAVVVTAGQQATEFAGKTPTAGYRFVAARLLADGRPDPRFDGDGVAVGPALDQAGSVLATRPAVGRDGGVVVAAELYNFGFGVGAVAARFAPDGSPDPGYGTNGAGLVLPTAGAGQVAAVEPRPDGGAVVVGGLGVARLTGDPRPAAGAVLAGGTAGGAARLVPPAGSTAGEQTSFFPGFPGTVRPAVADVTGDGVPDLVGGAGPGGGPNVAVVSGATGQRVADFNAFEPTFTGGVFVAAADIDGDGRAEVVVTPDRGGGPVVAVYSGAKLAAGLTGDAAQVRRFFGIDDPAFRGGARAALGDVNADGAPDVVVAAGFLGGPRVAVFDGKAVTAEVTPAVVGFGRLVGDFFAFESTVRNGAFVAAGDLDGDGAADLVFGGGPDGGPRVRVVSGRRLLAAPPRALDDPGAGGLQLANFFAGDPSFRGGVRVAVKDFDGDGRADLVTGSGFGEPARVRVYPAPAALAGGPPAREVDPFAGAESVDGVFVG